MTLRALLLPPAALLLLTPPAWSKEPAPKGPRTESTQVQAQPVPAQPVQAEQAPTPKGDSASASTARTESEEKGAEADPGATDYDKRRRAALISYKLGEIDASLTTLRELTAKCESEGAVCADTTRAELYVALAIVLAGGKDDVKGAARLFHAALTRDAAVTVPRELATSPVQEAMRLANESTSYKELTPNHDSSAAGAADSTTSERGSSGENSQTSESDSASEGNDDDDNEKDASRDRKTGLVLLHAIVGSGADDFSEGVSYGAAAVLGARFVDSSAWTTAIRGRVAVVGIDQEPVGGFSLLMGGTWQGARGKTMGYFLGGLGIDSYGNEGAVSANAMGGVALGGFLLGGGVDLGASDYGSFMMMCLHLGWGARL